MKQNRNRSNGRRYGSNHKSFFITKNTPFDSSSPFGRMKGTSSQLVEKYQSLAKDAKSNNDMVLYQTYLQYADHYGRMYVLACQNEKPKRQQQPSTNEEIVNTTPASEEAALEIDIPSIEIPEIISIDDEE